MTVPVQKPRNKVPISSQQVLLPWTWNLQAENELVVTVQRVSDNSIDDLFLDTDYTVDAGALDNDSGGNITLIGSEDPSTNGDIFTMTRDSILDRSEDYATSGAFLATTINEQLDELTRIDQDQQLVSDATVQKNPGVGDTLDPLIPQMVDRRALMFSDMGGGDFELIMSSFDPDATGDASQSAAEAAQSASDASASADEAAASAGSIKPLFGTTITKVFGDSPIVPVVGENGVLFAIDTSGGNVVINLSALATYAVDIRFAFIKTTGDANTITINRGSTDTINGGTSLVISDQYETATIVGDTSTGLWVTAAEAGKASSGGSFRGALVYKSADQAISTSALTILSFNSEDYDTDSIHDNATNNSRLTVPAGVTRVMLRANITWQTNTTGRRTISMKKNGGNYIGSGSVQINTADTSAPAMNMGGGPVTVSSGDYFEIQVFQNSGGNLDVNNTGGFTTWFAMEIIE